MSLAGTPIRRTLMLLSVLVLALGLAACGDESTGSEAGADVQEIVNDAVAPLESEIGELSDRVGALENAGEAVASEGDRLSAPLTAAEYGADPDQYVGQQVTISGTVSSLVGDHGFTIGADDIGGEGLLVVSSDDVGQQQLVETGAIVQVTGTVMEGFSAETVANDLGVEFADPTVYSAFEGENYLQAQNVSEAAESTEQG